MSDRTAVVTGGAQGIGKGIAMRLLQDGFRVVIADVDEEAGQETEAEYGGLGPIRFVRADIARESDVVALMDQAAAFGPLHALINNAGIADPGTAPVERLSLETWNRILGVNLTGCFLCTKHAAAHLRKSGGAIVNVASTRAMMSEPDTEAYCASKGGILALTHGLAVSLGPEVRVNCISPGWIDVRAWQKASECDRSDLRDEDHAQHPVGRVGRPEDVASLVSFLISEEAGFITGQNFVSDGGMTKKMIYF